MRKDWIWYDCNCLCECVMRILWLFQLMCGCVCRWTESVYEIRTYHLLLSRKNCGYSRKCMNMNFEHVHTNIFERTLCSSLHVCVQDVNVNQYNAWMLSLSILFPTFRSIVLIEMFLNIYYYFSCLDFLLFM